MLFIMFVQERLTFEFSGARKRVRWNELFDVFMRFVLHSLRATL
jgi:hypothetical protein